MDIQKITSNNKLVKFIVIGFIVVSIVWLIYSYSNKNVDRMENTPEVKSEVIQEVKQEMPKQENIFMPSPSDEHMSGAILPEMMKESKELSPTDLLPKSDAAADFEKQFPVGAGDLSSKNFLTAGFNIGINTVSSSLRNPNLSLRSDPYIPPKQVGPFLNSTIVPDMNRRPFEIGSD